MEERGYTDDKEESRSAAKGVAELKDELPQVAKLAELIYEYSQNQPREKVAEIVDGYFTVAKIEAGKLWMEDYFEPGGLVGPWLLACLSCGNPER
jgi:hypothetical protein